MTLICLEQSRAPRMTLCQELNGFRTLEFDEVHINLNEQHITLLLDCKPSYPLNTHSSPL